MKKVFGLIGSPHKETSHTCLLAKMLCDFLVEMDGDVSYELLTAGQMQLEFCNGCLSCMTRGTCPRDARDDMGQVRRKLDDADLVIFGSPVYGHNVSGQFKTIMDRLAMHCMVLQYAGKPGVSVVTADATYRTEVHDIIEPQMKYLGVIPVARLDACAMGPGTFADPDDAEQRAARAAVTVFPYLTGNKTPQPDAFTEDHFQLMKANMPKGKAYAPWVANYWHTHSIDKYPSFASYVHYRRCEVAG